MQTKFGVPINKFFKHVDYDTDIMISSAVYLEGADEYSVCVITQSGGIQIPEYATIKDMYDFRKGIIK